MVKKVIASNNEKLIRGANILADAVKSTLGPHGTNFVLEKGLRVTNDGVSIAQEIQSNDEIEDLGIRILREAAVKTNNEVGDGTTTACTLAQAVLKAVVPLVTKKDGVAVSRRTPSEVVAQIEREKDEVLVMLNDMATKIESADDLVKSAIVSTENKELGEVIGRTQWDLGKDGFLIPEQTAEMETTVERVNGIRLDNGFGTSFVINNQEKQSLEVEDVKVILTDNVLVDLKPIAMVLEQLVRSGSSKILVIARGFTEEAVKICAENHKAGVFIYPVNAPYVDQAEIMRDIAAITGATFFSKETASLEDIQLSDVGNASRILAYRYSSIIAGSKDASIEERVSARITELERQLAGEPSAFAQRNIKTRIAQLTNGCAMLKVGAKSEQERKYLFDKAEDACHAVRAALQEGTVPGAGLAFKEISDKLPAEYILKRPLCSIYEQIMSNTPQGFVIENWVRDPVKVLRIALERAVSVAGTLATAHGAVANERPKPRYVQETSATTEDA
jgi:chaperonin GroEL